MTSLPKKILLINSDNHISSSVGELCVLLNSELEVHDQSTNDVIDQIEKAWDLIIVHADQQHSKAIQICRQVKEKRPLCQIIVVSVNSNPEIAAGCLSNGADDFIIFPWNTVECYARANAALKRSEEVSKLLEISKRGVGATAYNSQPLAWNTSETSEIEYQFAGDVRLCRLKREVVVSDQVLQVTRTEFLLVAYLIENISRPCSSSELLLNVLGYEDDNYLPSLHSHVSRLRRKLKSSKTTTIETIWCFGYRILTKSLPATE